MRARALVALVIGAAIAAPTGAQGQAPDAASLRVVDRARVVGLYEVNKSWAATPVDYDRDGHQDVWIGYHQWSGKLWRNEGDGTYTRVAASAWPRVNADGRVPDRHDCAFADVDRDGRPDAYCSAGRNEDNRVKHGMDNELWLQRRPGVFTEVGTPWGLGDVCGRGRHVTFLYANADRYPDLFLGNAAPRRVPDPCDDPTNGLPNEGSKLFLNDRGRGFTYARRFGVSGTGPGQRCAEVLDYNGDGRDDLIVCRLKVQTPILYRNDAGTRLVNVSAANGLTQPLSDAVAADLDADGDQDLVTAAVGEFAYRLNNDGRFGRSIRIRAVPPRSEGRSVAVGDADGDGDLDVYAMLAGTSARSNPDDVIYLNAGLRFSGLRVPSAGGTADEVIALDPRGNGRAAFLVLNGGDLSGPVQFVVVR